MSIVDITRMVALYAALPVPEGAAEGESICASAIDDHGYYRIGRDVHGNAILLISTPTLIEDSQLLRSIRLKRLIVQHDVQCRVTDPTEGHSVDMSLSVIRCTDEALANHFLRIAVSIVNSLGAAPTRTEISSAVGRLADLFQALSNPMRGSAQGLWSELFLIDQSSDPALLVDSWRVDENDRFDFAHESQRLEVKSYAGSSRRHHFSLDQLRPLHGVIVIVASMQTVSSNAGPSIAELLQRVQMSLKDPNASLRVEEVAAETLGGSLDQELERRFDDAIAQETIRFFQVEDIPSIDADIPHGVYSVRFISDLEGIAELQSFRGALLSSLSNQT